MQINFDCVWLLNMNPMPATAPPHTHSLLLWQLHCVQHIVLVTQGQLKTWAQIQLNKRTEKSGPIQTPQSSDLMPARDQITDENHINK